MPQNPPRFFAPRYFAPGYWGGEQVEGSVSAALLGSSAMTAVLTGVESGYSGGGYLWRRRFHKVVLTKPKPAYIAARLQGYSDLEAKPIAAASMAAALNGTAQTFAAVRAIAQMGVDVSGGGRLAGLGAAPDLWAQAREEEEFWLIAA